MKKIIITFSIIISSFILYGQQKCYVMQFYKSVELPSNSKSLDGSSLEDIDMLLVPTKIDDGRYSVYVTKKGSNLYKIDGKNIYIETSMCFELCFATKAILIITNYSYFKGEIIFE